MRLVIQRVSEACVTVDGETTGEISGGLLALCGIHEDDDDAAAEWCAKKLTSIRLWADAGKQWNKSVGTGGILLVSQFTLFASLKGNKPDFHRAMGPATAEPFWERFVARVQSLHKSGPVQQGRFGAKMDVRLRNDGPVTIILDSPAATPPPTSVPAPVAAAAAAPPSPAAASLVLVVLRPAAEASTPLRWLEERGLRLVALKLVHGNGAQPSALAAVLRLPQYHGAALKVADPVSAVLDRCMHGSASTVQITARWQELFEESELVGLL